MSRTPQSLLKAAVLTVALLATSALPAGAAFTAGISGTNALTAGAHEDISMTLAFNDPFTNVRDIDIQMPPGMIGDPAAVSLCTIAQAEAANCPSSSQVGTTSVTAYIFVIETQIQGKVYLMEPRGDEVARLYAQVGPNIAAFPSANMKPIQLETPVQINSPGDFSLINPLRDLPKTSYVDLLGGTNYSAVDARIAVMTMTLWGERGHMTKPFMQSPTSCDRIRYRAKARSYQTGAWVSAQSGEVSVAGCDAPAFSPSLTAHTAQFTADAPSGISMTVSFPEPSGSGVEQSTVKSTRFVLPDGFAISAGSASGGLEACSDAQFAASSASTPSCPASSKVGTVAFATPLIPDVIEGDISIGNPTPGVPLRLLIHAEAPGPIHLKLEARAVPDPVSGQVTTVFENIPPIPFTSFTMNFRGGDHAMIKAPTTCGSGQAVAKMEPSARPGTFVNATATLTTSDCVQHGFSPQIDMSLGGLAAAGDSSMTMSFVRTDSDQRFGSMQMSLPSGMLGRLSSVQQCPIDQARAGNCSDASKVGTVDVTAGTGNAPLPLSGEVFLTTAFDGAVAGLAIIVRAKVGPIDLGVVPVIAKMTTRADMGIDVVSEPIPNITGGVPLFVRSMTINLNRSGFLFNSSSCAPRAITAQLGSLDGSVSNASLPYIPTGCSALPFSPAFSASLSGDLNKPGLTATMIPRNGDATMASMAMTLPTPLSADMNALSATCAEADFVAGRCGKKSQIGSAKAISSIISEPLTGPVYLVKLPDQVLPGLSVMLHGPIDVPVTIINGTAGGRLTSTVRDIPDVPMSSFEMTLAAGKLLQSDRKALCAKKQTIKAVFTGHNGGRSETSPALKYDCNAKTFAPAPRAKASGSIRIRGKRVALKLTLKGKRMTGAKITLPRSGLKLRRKAVRNAAILKSGTALLHRSMIGAKGQTMTLKLPAAKRKSGVSKLSLDLSASAIGKAAKLKRGKSVTIVIRVTHKGGGTSNLRLKLKAK